MQCLLEKLREGEFALGQCLPTESDLSQLFGVSRGTIRAATHGLAQLGYLIIRQGSETFVTTPSQEVLPPFKALLTDKPQLAGEFLQYRRFIEPEVARLAAEKCSPHDAKILVNQIGRQ